MKYLKAIVGVGALVVIALALWLYWQHSAQYPSTDDAYVEAHIITIAPELTGRVTVVNVSENQLVAAGDILFQIDDTTFANAAKQADLQVKSLQQGNQALVQQVAAATGQVTSATNAKQVADDQATRTQTLFASGTATQVQVDADKAAAIQADAALAAAQSQLAEANSAVTRNQDAIVVAQSQLDTAKISVEQAIVRAPVSGWIANLSLRPGSVVAAYQPQFSLVDAQSWWVEANFQETDLPRIVPGLPVTVSVDMMPGVTLTGRVSSLGIGSGATFSLLPAQNASGNWVKVTQRFPVRVTLDKAPDGLRVGASATAIVDTTATPATAP